MLEVKLASTSAAFIPIFLLLDRPGGSRPKRMFPGPGVYICGECVEGFTTTSRRSTTDREKCELTTPWRLIATLSAQSISTGHRFSPEFKGFRWSSSIEVGMMVSS
jgi:hypothetical protein